MIKSDFIVLSLFLCVHILFVFSVPFGLRVAVGALHELHYITVQYSRVQYSTGNYLTVVSIALVQV